MIYEKTKLNDVTFLETFENENLKATTYCDSATFEFKPTCSEKVKDIYAKLMEDVKSERRVQQKGLFNKWCKRYCL